MNRRVVRPPLPEWLEPLVAGFLGARERRGRDPKTIDLYDRYLRQFGCFLAAETDIRSLVELKLRHVEAFQDDLARRGKSASTRQVATIAIKGLLRWCARQELELSSPYLYGQIETPGVKDGDPRPISAADLRVVLRALRDPRRQSLEELRTRALFLALLSTGSRITALLALNRDSIKDGVAEVVQKGSRPHALVFSDEALGAIATYLRAREDSCPAMFASHRACVQGSPCVVRRLDRWQTRTAWFRLADELGIPRWSNHQIRHTTGTELVRAKVDVVTAARVLGHRGLGQMMVYVRTSLEQRREAAAVLDLVG